MIRISQLKLPCGHTEADLEGKIRKTIRHKGREPVHYRIRRHSIDARKKPQLYDIYTVDVDTKTGAKAERRLAASLRSRNISYVEETGYQFPKAGEEIMHTRPVVIGAGPAGLFCALMLAEHGYREGGAGTFSDGKLNTQINDKTGRSEKVLTVFTEAGAPGDIVYESKPHIGTDRLKVVIPAIRRRIQAAGGEVRFEAQVTDLEMQDGSVRAVILADGSRIRTDTVVLAPGHSARDTMTALYQRGIPMEAKAFAIGLRVSHPQSLIDKSQYGVWEREEMQELGLTAAPYKLTARAASGRGVYSFCMCPGGYIVDASSEPSRIAVNGMSEHARGSERANSAIVVTIGPEEYGTEHPLSGMDFQRALEEKAYRIGRGAIPVQRYVKLKENYEKRKSGEVANSNAPDPYLTSHDLCIRGQWTQADLSDLLPASMTADFIEGMEEFDRKIPGFAGEEAFAAGLESRTSSPVRIPRGEDLQSQIRGLYPCGEGAGYAGGIMSAAMDGIRVAEAIRKRYAAPVDKNPC